MEATTQEQRITAILQSPDFISSVLADLKTRAQQERRFEQSEVFSRMLETLRAKPYPIALNSEHFLYFAKDCKRELGWEFATDEDVQLFFAVMGNSEGPNVKPGSLTSDPACPFHNEAFEHYGLRVFRLFGLDVITQVFKD